MPLSREEKKMAYDRSRELRKNPPRPTQEHFDGADKLLAQHDAFEAEKDRDCKREYQNCSKDMASFAFNKIKGNFTVVQGEQRFDEKSCGVNECYICHTTDSLWRGGNRPARRAVFHAGFSTYCIACFIKHYIPTEFKERRQKFFNGITHLNGIFHIKTKLRGPQPPWA